MVKWLGESWLTYDFRALFCIQSSLLLCKSTDQFVVGNIPTCTSISLSVTVHRPLQELALSLQASVWAQFGAARRGTLLYMCASGCRSSWKLVQEHVSSVLNLRVSLDVPTHFLFTDGWIQTQSTENFVLLFQEEGDGEE